MLEIERKFLVLVDRLPESLKTSHGRKIEQGYLATDPAVRVRVSTNGRFINAYLAVKAHVDGCDARTRHEFEYSIPFPDATAMLEMCHTRISKVRRSVPTSNLHCWDIDEFTGPHAGLWLAEIELDAPDEDFERPPWLGDEVTFDPRYINVALAIAGAVPA